MHARLPQFLEDDLLGPCAALADSERARRPGRFDEGVLFGPEVGGSPEQVPRVRHATHRAVSSRSATTAGEAERRMYAHQGADVGSGVGSEACQ
jgi:hypothetical protein